MSCCHCQEDEHQYKTVTKHIRGRKKAIVVKTRSGERGTSKPAARKEARRKNRRYSGKPPLSSI